MKYSGSISDRIKALRAEMRREKIDLYIIPSTDYHNSEYIGEYFKERQYMTGFTGSAGTVVFTEEKAGLWTDGRYFIQAEQELQGSEIILFKAGEPGCPEIEEFIRTELPEGGKIGFDGRTIRVEQGKEFEKIAEENAERCLIFRILSMLSGKTDRLCRRKKHSFWMNFTREKQQLLSWKE